MGSPLCRLVLCIFLCGVAMGQSEFDPSCPEKRMNLKQAAKTFRRDLSGKIMPFLLDTVIGSGDNASAGYRLGYDALSGRLNSTSRQLVSQARMLYTFSLLHNEVATNGFQRRQLLEAADVGYAFLEDYFFDPVWGGYYWMVEDDGTPLMKEKNARGQMTVILAYVEYARAKDDAEFAERAQSLYNNISRLLMDEEFGLYIEDFEEDWTPIRRPVGRGPTVSYGLKTQVFVVEMLEALTELFIELGRTNTEVAIEQILDSDLDQFFPADPAKTIRSLSRNLRLFEVGGAMSYGVYVHYAYVLVNAEIAIGRDPSWKAFDAYVRFSIAEGRQKGGLLNDDELVWWASDNLIMALATAIENGRGREYEGTLKNATHFEMCYLIDPTHGLSIWSVDRRGEPVNTNVLVPWKAAFHEVRARTAFVRAIQSE